MRDASFVIGGRRRRLHSCRLRSLTMGCACSTEEEPPVDEGDFADVAVKGEVEAGETNIEVNSKSLSWMRRPGPPPHAHMH